MTVEKAELTHGEIRTHRPQPNMTFDLGSSLILFTAHPPVVSINKTAFNDKDKSKRQYLKLLSHEETRQVSDAIQKH